MHTIGRSLSLLTALLALSSAGTLPRQRARSLRQVEIATPYPAAGFRPEIPFELPNRRQPKISDAETEPLGTTTSSRVDFVAVTETLTTINTQPDVDVRTPVNTYGAPQASVTDENQVIAEDNVEVVAQTPSDDFQPPLHETVQDFIVDLPTNEDSNDDLTPQEVPINTEQDSKTAATPATVYRAPISKSHQKPAATYGVPNPTAGLDLEVPENELESSQVELIDEETETGLGFASGRLVILPAGASKRKAGTIFLAIPQEQQRKIRIQSERLRRF